MATRAGAAADKVLLARACCSAVGRRVGESSIFVLMKWGARRPRGERIAPYDCRAIPGPDGTRTFKVYGARGARARVYCSGCGTTAGGAAP